MKANNLAIVVLAILAPALEQVAVAQVTCQCEYDDWVGECRAEFERQGDIIILKSDTEQCSRVDWYTDAQPRLSVVVNKHLAQELLGIPSNAEISISSCNVCRDSRFDSDSSSPSSTPGGGAGSDSAPNSFDVVDLWVNAVNACDPTAHVTRDDVTVKGAPDGRELLRREQASADEAAKQIQLEEIKDDLWGKGHPKATSQEKLHLWRSVLRLNQCRANYLRSQNL